MKNVFIVLLAAACTAGAALAGPNAGGVIFVHYPQIGWNGLNDQCNHGAPPASCETANTRVDGGDWVYWKCYAAFRPCAVPRLKAIDFGINYNPWDPGNPNGLVLLGHGACIGDLNNGAAELPGARWPDPGTYDDIIFERTQTSTLVEFYWFAGYAYYGARCFFSLTPGQYGGAFADDSQPALIDPIAGYGTLGFNQPGSVTCPEPLPTGACCLRTQCFLTCEEYCPNIWLGPGTVCLPLHKPCMRPAAHVGACCVGYECYVLTRVECIEMGGTYLGDNVPCEPAPCTRARPQSSAPGQVETWGKIKSSYR